ISATHYHLVRDLFERGMLPRHGAILEIGEANWYDLDPLTMVDDIRRFVSDPARGEQLIALLRDLVERKPDEYLFHIAKVYYELSSAPVEMQAIDFQGTKRAHRFDLNAPVTLDRRFDVVINHRMAEHIFNIAQVFKTIHDYTVPGGMMIHEAPF